MTTTSDEIANELVYHTAKSRLRRYRWYRFGTQMTTLSFAVGFAFVLLNEPVLTTGVVMMLVGTLIGVFASFSMTQAVSAQVVTEKMIVELAKLGLMGSIVALMRGTTEDGEENG